MITSVIHPPMTQLLFRFSLILGSGLQIYLICRGLIPESESSHPLYYLLAVLLSLTIGHAMSHRFHCLQSPALAILAVTTFSLAFNPITPILLILICSGLSQGILWPRWHHVAQQFKHPALIGAGLMLPTAILTPLSGGDLWTYLCFMSGCL